MYIIRQTWYDGSTSDEGVTIMARKQRYQFTHADGHGSPVARAAFQRNGAGTHADTRTRRQRSRSDARRAAIRDAS